MPVATCSSIDPRAPALRGLVLLLVSSGCGGDMVVGASAAAPPSESEQGRFDPTASCEPIRIGAHLGGDAQHDACADRYGPNDFWSGAIPGSGSDALVKGVNFDGIFLTRDPASYPHKLHEMKVLDWDRYNTFIQGRQLDSDMEDIRNDLAAVMACGYRYDFVTTNESHYWAVVARVMDLTDRGLLPRYEGFQIVKYFSCPEAR